MKLFMSETYSPFNIHLSKFGKSAVPHSHKISNDVSWTVLVHHPYGKVLKGAPVLAELQALTRQAYHNISNPQKQ